LKGSLGGGTKEQIMNALAGPGNHTIKIYPRARRRPNGMLEPYRNAQGMKRAKELNDSPQKDRNDN
jgi:hypothetical protein